MFSPKNKAFYDPANNNKEYHDRQLTTWFSIYYFYLKWNMILRPVAEIKQNEQKPSIEMENVKINFRNNSNYLL